MRVRVPSYAVGVHTPDTASALGANIHQSDGVLPARGEEAATRAELEAEGLVVLQLVELLARLDLRPVPQV